jgi:hypothetical protein
MDTQQCPSQDDPSTGAAQGNAGHTTLSRRGFLRLSAGATVASGAAALHGSDSTVAAEASTQTLQQPSRASVEKAFTFLNTMMDAYQPGTTLRLVQSYSDQNNLGSTAFVYDNALVIIAYLLRGRRDDLARAALLGASYLYAQANDPQYNDGRLRQAYWVGPFEIPGLTANSEYFIQPDGKTNLAEFPWFFTGSAVGDMAWSAIALAQLHARTREQQFLDGAVRLGQWIVDNTYSDQGLGGYSFGVNGNNEPIPNKSTEHNIDVYALFNNLLAPLTGDPTWIEYGRHALEFMERVWNAEAGFFYTGSNDGATINPSPLPEDPQSWSYLALKDPSYAVALDWAKTNLATTDTPQSANASFTGNLRFNGVTFSDVSLRVTTPSSQFDPPPDPDAVWFEGTAHMAAALLERKLGRNRDLPTFDGDIATAHLYLRQIELAQAALGKNETVNGAAISEATGIVAASSVLNTGFGFSYFPRLHIGATAWYLIAALSGNPYQRLRR